MMPEVRSALGWRIVWFGLVALILSPVLVFLISSLLENPPRGKAPIISRAFLAALGRSLREALLVAGIAFLAGWPAGTLCGAQKGAGTRVCALLLLLPMTAPAFVWAVSLQALRPMLPLARQAWLDGFSGVVCSLLPQALPLPLIAAWAAARKLPLSAPESALLNGGRRGLFRALMHHTCRPAAAGAFMAAALVFADAGCDQIMGCHGFSSEVLIAFNMRHDFTLASVKALCGGAFLLPAALLAAWLGTPLLMERQPGRSPADSAGRSWFSGRLVFVTLLILTAVTVVIPCFGLMRPLLLPGPSIVYLEKAAALWRERAAPTLQLPLTAVAVSAGLGMLLAVITRKTAYTRTVFALALLLLAMPPSFSALGFLRSGSWYPGLFAFLREYLSVPGLAAGLKTAPLAAVFFLDAWKRLPAAAEDAARQTGVSPWRWHFTVIVPLLLPAALAAAGLSAVLAMAETSTHVLLQSPGSGTFTSYLFAVMDNAPAKTVAALCLVHLASLWTIGFLALTVSACLKRLPVFSR